MKILAFGEVLWDIIEDKKLIGGAPFNFAAHAAKCGAQTAILSAVGTDELGMMAQKAVRQLDVGDEFLQKNEHPTGTVRVALTDGSPNYVIFEEVAYDYINILDVDLTALSGFDAFYFGTLAQRSETSRKALYGILEQVDFSTIFYDVNLRENGYTREILENSFERCTIVKMNDEEVSVLSKLFYDEVLTPENYSRKLRREYPSIEMLVVTKGPDGCSIYTQEKSLDIPGEPIAVTDTVGAGDSFSASFLVTYLKTNNPSQAAQVGNKVGGFVASSEGAVPEYPEELIQEIVI